MLRLKNWLLILRGKTLVQRRMSHIQVRWDWNKFKQEWTSPRRKKSYRLDDEGWTVLNET